jgi:hypothetical protein
MITNQNNKSTYVGNNNTTVFPRLFPVWNANQVKVVLTENNTDTVLTLGTHYTVQGVNNPNPSTWTITYPVNGTPLTPSQKLTIVSKVPYLQDTDFANQGGFFAETHEDVADKMVLMVQQLAEEVSRAVKVAIGSNTTPEALIAQLQTDAANATASAAAAATSATNAANSAAAAATSATNAASSATAAQNSQNKAQQWAENPYNVPVDPGQYSAKHWAIVAQNNAAGDMLKSTYDTDDDGVVDAAESVPWSGVTGKPNTFTPSSHTHPASDLTQSGAANGDVLQWNGTAWVPAAPSSSSLNFVVLKDVKASGTNGQTLTVNTWNKRDINTEETDTGNICTLNNSQFTLPAGTYLIQVAITSGTQGAARKAIFRLRNITGSSDVLFGNTYNYESAYTNHAMSFLAGVFTVNASTTFEIQEHPKSSNGNPIASGYAASVSGFSECYLTAVITKVA